MSATLGRPHIIYAGAALTSVRQEREKAERLAAKEEKAAAKLAREQEKEGAKAEKEAAKEAGLTLTNVSGIACNEQFLYIAELGCVPQRHTSQKGHSSLSPANDCLCTGRRRLFTPGGAPRHRMSSPSFAAASSRLGSPMAISAPRLIAAQ